MGWEGEGSWDCHHGIGTGYCLQVLAQERVVRRQGQMKCQGMR